MLLLAILAGITLILLAPWWQSRPPKGVGDLLGEQREGMLKSLHEQANAIREATEQSLNRHFTSVDRKLAENRETTHSLLKNLGERLRVTELLNDSVQGLQRTLTDKRQRGAFGELRLEQLVKDQLPSQFYEFQASIGDEKKYRVDCLIKLPPPTKLICVDSKFPLSSYDGMDEQRSHGHEATAAKKVFATALRQHIKDIASKYIIPGLTQEHAGMFLPSEGLYILVHDEFPKVVDYARQMRVVILSPSSLWVILNSMSAIIKDIQIHERAKLIQKEVGLLLQDSRRMAERWDKLQRHFSSARRDLDELGISVRKVSERSDKIDSMDFEENKKIAKD